MNRPLNLNSLMVPGTTRKLAGVACQPSNIFSGGVVDKITGFLEVGIDGNEIVINHPDLLTDENGVGHIVFSPNQARNLAWLLLEKANELDPDPYTFSSRVGHP